MSAQYFENVKPYISAYYIVDPADGIFQFYLHLLTVSPL